MNINMSHLYSLGVSKTLAAVRVVTTATVCAVQLLATPKNAMKIISLSNGVPRKYVVSFYIIQDFISSLIIVCHDCSNAMREARNFLQSLRQLLPNRNLR